MKLVKTICDVSLVILCIVSLIVTGLFVYYRYIDPTRTIGVNNISDQVSLDYESYTGELTESEIKELEDRMLFEVNIYTNENMNGITLVEFQFNYFTTYELKFTDYRSSGIQFVFNNNIFEQSFGKENSDIMSNEVFGFDLQYNENFPTYSSNFVNYMCSEVNMYEKTTSVDWSSNGPTNTGLTRDTEYIIKIDDEAYSINLNKTYKKSEPWLGFLWNVENEYQRTWDQLITSVIRSASQTSKGEGTCYITPDFSDFFTVKKFSDEGVLYEQVYTDIVNTYAVVKVNYNLDGAYNSSQSLFGMIDNNPNFDLYGNNLDTEYWASSITYNLDSEDLDYRYSESYNGYLVSLSQGLINKINDMPRTKVNLTIDLDSDFVKNHNYNIVGLDYNALSNIDLYELSILSDSDTSFVVLDNAIDDSLDIFRHSDTIILSFVNSSLPSGVEGVIV